MDEKVIAELLGERLRNKIHYFDSIDSTNSRLKELALNGAPEGTLVIADAQTAGRGRLGRSFVSEKGRGVYMSVLLRPDCRADEAPGLTANAAAAVCRALDRFGVNAQIKWVNDVFLGGRKICGILCESAVGSDGRLSYAVIGVGLNVLGDGFPPEIRDIAGSVQSQSGLVLPREKLCSEIYRELKDMYSAWKKDPACYIEDYRRRSLLTGKSVRIGNETAAVLGISDDFGLTVSTHGGVKILRCGEVSVKL